jgi:hypothetical protein
MDVVVQYFSSSLSQCLLCEWSVGHLTLYQNGQCYPWDLPTLHWVVAHVSVVSMTSAQVDRTHTCFLFERGNMSVPLF